MTILIFFIITILIYLNKEIKSNPVYSCYTSFRVNYSHLYSLASIFFI